jgi:hypothetical protein
MEKKISLAGGTPGVKPKQARETYFVGVYNKKGKLRALKIGLATRGRTAARVANLQTGSVDTLKVLAIVEGGSAERKFHRQFAGFRFERGEFFKPAPEILKLIENLKQIRSLVERVEGTTACGPNISDTATCGRRNREGID